MKKMVKTCALVATTALSFNTFAEGPDFNNLPKVKLTSPLKQTKPTGFGTWQNFKSYKQGSINNWPRVTAIAYGQPDNHGITNAEKAACGNKFPAHLGTDYSGAGESKLGNGDGSPVYAVADGVVRWVNGFTSAGDYHVIIVSGTSTDKKGNLTDPWTALYGHLSSKVLVSRDSKVRAGQQIGTLFNYTDDTDKPHLHFGIRKGDYVSKISSQGFVCYNSDGKTFDSKQFINADSLSYTTDYLF